MEKLWYDNLCKGLINLIFSESLLFLLLLLVIGIIAKNKALLIAISVLLVLKISGLDTKSFTFLQSKGINWGVIIITIAVLAPIASGEIGFKDLTSALKSPIAWVALISGMLVALLAKNGVSLLATDPQITTALVLGTILSVALFKGVAVGPLIGAGIAYTALKMINFFS
ncbi:MAG: rane protein [Neobacillus sp.]|jgi:uncharacterized membrane protein (DUF441 family)|nr:rane protein [Neobacillus sp.]